MSISDSILLFVNETANTTWESNRIGKDKYQIERIGGVLDWAYRYFGGKLKVSVIDEGINYVIMAERVFDGKFALLPRDPDMREKALLSIIKQEVKKKK